MKSSADKAAISPEALPFADRRDEHLQGHWLLARLGKRVLRPGGAELTAVMLHHAGLTDKDVVELAPGLGRTATEIMERGPKSYVGVDQDPAAATAVAGLVEPLGRTVVAEAAATGLPDGCADVVVGEAMLTMQTDPHKNDIIREAVRLLRSGGVYAIHELALAPDDLPEAIKTDIRKALARSIKVNARPLTVAEWRELLEHNGLQVQAEETAAMALLQSRRLLADEGFVGTMRFTKNLMTHHAARKRVLVMRSVFQKYRKHLLAISLVVRKG